MAKLMEKHRKVGMGWIDTQRDRLGERKKERYNFGSVSVSEAKPNVNDGQYGHHFYYATYLNLLSRLSQRRQRVWSWFR